MIELRIGQGFDAHSFSPNRPLILGGVKIPYEFGLAGHSDADCLTHAIIDALLGAASLGDIGVHFPPSDPTYKDIFSLDLLRRVSDFLKTDGWEVINVDATIIAQSPIMSPYTAMMQKNIKECILKAPSVSIKATTTEGMGFTGRKEGIAALAVALISRQKGE